LAHFPPILVCCAKKNLATPLKPQNLDEIQFVALRLRGLIVQCWLLIRCLFKVSQPILFSKPTFNAFNAAAAAAALKFETIEIIEFGIFLPTSNWHKNDFFKNSLFFFLGPCREQNCKFCLKIPTSSTYKVPKLF
jgi:hypothetical protein